MARPGGVGSRVRSDFPRWNSNSRIRGLENNPYRETLAGLRPRQERERRQRIHRNAQRLLQTLPVVNPYAPQLTFQCHRTRTRRDHLNCLTPIRSIVLLHQYQGQTKSARNTPDGVGTDGTWSRRERPMGTGTAGSIEVELSDIEAANRIAHEVLGRSLDELPPQSCRLLGLLRELIQEKNCQQGEAAGKAGAVPAQWGSGPAHTADFVYASTFAGFLGKPQA